MEKIYNYVQDNPNKKIVGSEMTYFNIEFYHIISLLIGDQKYTKEFLVWKTQCALESITAAITDYDTFANVLCRRYYEARGRRKDITSEALYEELNIVDLTANSMTNIVQKLIILFFLLEKKGITEEEVFAKY